MQRVVLGRLYSTKVCLKLLVLDAAPAWLGSLSENLHPVRHQEPSSGGRSAAV